MRESLQSVDKRVLFRETFTPESIAHNGGVITGGVSLADGIATFDGSTGDINYGAINDMRSSSFTIHVRLIPTKVIRTTTGYVFYKVQNISGNNIGIMMNVNINGNIYMFAYNAGVLYYAKIAPIFAVGTPIEIFGWVDRGTGRVAIDVDGATAVSGVMGADSLSNGADFLIGGNSSGEVLEDSLELLEIYDGVLTQEERNLIRSDNLHRGYIKEGLVLDCDYISGSVINKIHPELAVTNTDVQLAHGVGAVFNGSSSYLNYGNHAILLGLDTFSIEVVYTNYSDSATFATLCSEYNYQVGGFLFGVTKDQILVVTESAGLESSKFISTVDTRSTPSHYVFTHDGTTLRTYRGGVLIDVTVLVYAPNTTTDFLVGRKSTATSSNYLLGGMGLMRVYKNKVLTSENVAQNYQYAKKRYGL